MSTTTYDNIVSLQNRINELEKEVMIGLHNQENNVSQKMFQIEKTLSVIEIKIPMLQKKMNLLQNEVTDFQEEYNAKKTSESMETLFIVTLFLSIIVSVVTNRLIL